MTTLHKIQELIQGALVQSELWDELKNAGMENFHATVEYPRDPEHGDYATNVAMQLAKPLKKNPREVASIVVDAIMQVEGVENVIEGTPEIAGPGFINIRVHTNVLTEAIENSIAQGEKFGHSDHLKGQKIAVEFATPNTHKAAHIGHLRNICLGESIVRFLESQGAEVFRANYQGDVGPHVAKCLWGMMNAPEGTQRITTAEQAEEFECTHLSTPEAKVDTLGKYYAIGGTAYAKDKDGSMGIQSAVKEINKRIYQKDPSIFPLWEVTRRWSLEYFDHLYKRLYTHFDRLFFESEMYERGIEIVKAHLGKVFEESDGAIVFKGEEYGLHTRVFVTGEGNATYEGKDIANAATQYEEFNFDRMIHVVGNEQAGYFKVLIKAIELVHPHQTGKQYHLSYGMVNLSTGKMSSRTGDIVTARSLIEDAKTNVFQIFEESNSEFTTEEKHDIAEKVALGAVKFTMLHADSKRDIAFDMEQSLRLTGDSGPYIQYGYTRIVSILEKVEDSTAPDYTRFNEMDWKLAKQLLRFEEEVTKSADELTTHNTAHYLVGVVSEFSRWYEHNRVAESEPGLRAARLELLKAVRNVIANGLNLLGIKTVEKM